MKEYKYLKKRIRKAERLLRLRMHWFSSMLLRSRSSDLRFWPMSAKQKRKLKTMDSSVNFKVQSMMRCIRRNMKKSKSVSHFSKMSSTCRSRGSRKTWSKKRGSWWLSSNEMSKILTQSWKRRQTRESPSSIELSCKMRRSRYERKRSSSTKLSSRRAIKPKSQCSTARENSLKPNSRSYSRSKFKISRPTFLHTKTSFSLKKST